MRKNFDFQLTLNQTPVHEVVIPLNSRDELPPILMGLQYIYKNPELREKVFSILKQKITDSKKKTGRQGMNLWEILVLAVVRLGLDCNYDRLEDLANHHILIRQITGAETGFGSNKKYAIQTIKDNVRLIDDQVLYQINDLVVEQGHKLLKKKENTPLEIKADTYVLETNIHFPTDINLLWDATRKCIDITIDLIEQKYIDNQGWRKIGYIKKAIKQEMLNCNRAIYRGGKNKESAIHKYVTLYLLKNGKLSRRIGSVIEFLLRKNMQSADLLDEFKLESMIKELSYYHQHLNKHIDLVGRRLLNKESIPASEKVYSLFEPHTEWLYKGKANRRIELGHKIVVATDQHGFVLDYAVTSKQADTDMAEPIMKRLISKWGEGKINSISFDKGFYSKSNKEILKEEIPMVIMPKRGKKSLAEIAEESAKEFKKLRHRHSAIESDINCLEHHGLNRCPDKGLASYKKYCGLGILSMNIHRLGNILKVQEIKKMEKLKQAA